MSDQDFTTPRPRNPATEEHRPVTEDDVSRNPLLPPRNEDEQRQDEADEVPTH